MKKVIAAWGLTSLLLCIIGFGIGGVQERQTRQFTGLLSLSLSSQSSVAGSGLSNSQVDLLGHAQREPPEVPRGTAVATRTDEEVEAALLKRASMTNQTLRDLELSDGDLLPVATAAVPIPTRVQLEPLEVDPPPELPEDDLHKDERPATAQRPNTPLSSTPATSETFIPESLKASTAAPEKASTWIENQFPSVKALTPLEMARQARERAKARKTVLKTNRIADSVRLYLDKVTEKAVVGWVCSQEKVIVEGTFLPVEDGPNVTVPIYLNLSRPDVSAAFPHTCGRSDLVGFSLTPPVSFQVPPRSFRFLLSVRVQTTADATSSSTEVFKLQGRFTLPVYWVTFSSRMDDPQTMITALTSLRIHGPRRDIIPVHLSLDGPVRDDIRKLFAAVGGLALDVSKEKAFQPLRMKLGTAQRNTADPTCLAKAYVPLFLPTITKAFHDMESLESNDGPQADPALVLVTRIHVIFGSGFDLSNLPRPRVAALGQVDLQQPLTNADVMLINTIGFSRNLSNAIYASYESRGFDKACNATDFAQTLVSAVSETRLQAPSQPGIPTGLSALLPLPPRWNYKCYWGFSVADRSRFAKSNGRLSVSDLATTIGIMHLYGPRPGQCLELTQFPRWQHKEKAGRQAGCPESLFARYEPLLIESFNADRSRLCQEVLALQNHYLQVYDDEHPTNCGDTNHDSLATGMKKVCRLVHSTCGRPRGVTESGFSTCTNDANVVCPRHSREKGQSLRGSALVSYGLPMLRSDPTGPEWDNVNFFIRNGIFPDQVSEMFDQVDFVLFRIHPTIAVPTLYRSVENVHMLWIPKVPCDLCGHAKVLEYLGYHPNPDSANGTTKEWKYKSVIMLNSGTRGPFLSSRSSHWVDVVSMAGQPGRFYLQENDKTTFKAVAASLFSWEGAAHPQSYFLAVPPRLLPSIYYLFARSCLGNFDQCIGRGEVEIGRIALRDYGYLYISAFNVTIQDTESTSRFKGTFHDPNAQNPTLRYWNPCHSVFLKYGGQVWRMGLLPRSTIDAVRALSSRTFEELGKMERSRQGPTTLPAEGSWRSIRQLVDVIRNSTGSLQFFQSWRLSTV